MNQLENGNRKTSSSGRSRSQGSDKNGRSSQRGSSGRKSTGSRSGSSYSSSSRRSGSHHRKKGPDYSKFAFVGVVLIVVIACGVFLASRQKSASTEDSVEETSSQAEIIQEVTVDGVTITGMSIDQAREAILAQYPWNMKIVYGEDSYEVTDLMAGKVETLLQEIYSSETPGQTYNLDTSGLEEGAAQEAASAAAKWDKAAVNGSIDSYDKDSDSFVFAGEQAGFAIDQEKLAADILKALSDRDFDAEIKAEGSQVQPEISKETAKGKYKIISTFTTNTTANSNRNTNVKLAAQAINGTIVKPGEEFSFNKTVGQRTEAKGYKGAAAYNNGEVVQEIGGGVCQVSTTLFNTVYRAGLESSFRRSHTFEPSYITPGQDATVSYEQPDYKFVNNTSAAIGIRASYSNQKMTVSIYGIPVLEEGVKWDMVSEKVETLDPPAPTYEEDQTLELDQEKVKSAGTSGSRWVTYKVITKDGVEISREVDHKTTYKGHAPIILRNTSGVVLRPEETTTGEETIMSTVDGMPDGYIPESTGGSNQVGPGVSVNQTTVPSSTGPGSQQPTTAAPATTAAQTSAPAASFEQDAPTEAPTITPIAPNPGV